MKDIIDRASDALRQYLQTGDTVKIADQLEPFFLEAVNLTLGLTGVPLPADPSLVEAKRAVDECFQETDINKVAVSDRVRLIQTLRGTTEQRTSSAQWEQAIAALRKLERQVKVYEQTIYVMLDSRVRDKP